MKTPWIRPEFEEIGVGGECTAYAGVAPASPARTAGAPRSQAEAALAQAGSLRVRGEEREDR